MSNAAWSDTATDSPMKDLAGTRMHMKTQFSLRQLLLAILIFATCLGVGRWCYIKYFDGVVPITTDCSLDARNRLDSYVGRRVSLLGRYEHTGDRRSYEIVWFGNQPIAVRRISANGARLSSVLDGASIRVKGRLTYTSSSISAHVTIRRGGLLNGQFLEDVKQVVVYLIDAEEMQVTSLR